MSASSKVCVLVVDDDDDARELLRTVLEDRFDVVVAGSAAEAFALIETRHPDVIVSDIAMPDEDGYALIARIRALPKGDGGGTPAVAVTAYSARSDREKALDAGFDRHMAKPVDLEALVAVVDELARNGRRA